MTAEAPAPDTQLGYFVDRVVICDAYSEPDQHYQLRSGGRSKRADGRRPSMRYLASARDMGSGIAGITGREAGLFEDMVASPEQLNDFVNDLRHEIKVWRCGEDDWSGNPYGGTAIVTRRLLEWWFERDEERRAEGKRFFFAQREAVEAIIYLYEVKGRHKMPETEDFVRYASKLATGTGKTVVMAMLVTWSTLHKTKVSGSTLSKNFLVLAPNLTVRDRVSGIPRGDGLDPSGAENLYDAFAMVPPEYADEFRPNVKVRNWQSIPLEGQRDDWIPDTGDEEGRFVPASVLWALRRRARQDPNASVRRFLEGWRDVVIINDEAHHVYGEKRGKKGDDPEYIKWSKIVHRVAQVARVGVVLDLSATPWYGSGSPKPEGTLFEWLVSDFSVYDAFESGLVKVVRLPEPDSDGSQYLDLWDQVKGAKTKEEYLSACKGAIASIYSDWNKDFREWSGMLLPPGPSPVLLVVADRAERAKWIFEHLSRDYDLLRNDGDDPKDMVTVRIDSSVFDAEKGNEVSLREMVNTVGRKGQAGERVRCIVSVNMLSEGWDVKSVTNILGLRAFGSPLLTEQIIGRGLRRANYDVLNQPLEERPTGGEETVDAFGIPFVGFPIERKRKRPPIHRGTERTWIEPDTNKQKYALRVPNVRSWAVGVSRPLAQSINIQDLPELVISPKDTPPQVRVRPVVGGESEAIMTLDDFRAEFPLLRSKMIFARELYEATNPGNGNALGIGPTYEELLDVASEYVDLRVRALGDSRCEDIGIYFWSRKALDILETAVRETSVGTTTVPILGTPEFLATEELRRFQWTGLIARGKKCHTNSVPCHTDLEREFADFLDSAPDVTRYFKNERFGFSVTYYENNRPRQYYPDFIVGVRGEDGKEVFWLAETKGEIRHNTALKEQSASRWCEKMSSTEYGTWEYLFVPQRKFEQVTGTSVSDFAQLASLSSKESPPKLSLAKSFLCLEEIRAGTNFIRIRSVSPQHYRPCRE